MAEETGTVVTVPPQYIGVWKRTLLKTKRGTHDTTSEAYWLQSERLHCDLRIPTAALEVGTKKLTQCSDAELEACAVQYAFAGHTVVGSHACKMTLQCLSWQLQSTLYSSRLDWQAFARYLDRFNSQLAHAPPELQRC